MKFLTHSLTFLHVIAGFASLLLFWIPMFTRKGGINHVRLGKWYVWLMWIVVVSAAILSIKNLWTGAYEASAFLGFLTFITANPLWKGIAVLNNKKGLSNGFVRTQLILEIGTFLMGFALLTYGIYLGGQGAAVLMIIFGILGISNAKGLWKLVNQPPQRTDWLLDHISEMITTGIAAYTAFFAFGGRTWLGDIFTGYWMIVPWVAPTIIGIFTIKWYKKQYRKKQGGKETLVVTT